MGGIVIYIITVFFHPFLDHTCNTSNIMEEAEKGEVGRLDLRNDSRAILFIKILQEFILRRFFPLQFFKNIMSHVNLYISRYL